jgi:hypothetical protein
MVDEEDEAFGTALPGPSCYDLLNHSILFLDFETGARVRT